jgi:hypothetical protein
MLHRATRMIRRTMASAMGILSSAARRLVDSLFTVYAKNVLRNGSGELA